MADRTRAIVRLEVSEGMVTKGYRKGVYERVTKGITAESTAAAGIAAVRAIDLCLSVVMQSRDVRLPATPH
jgi:hypothetical protein